MDNRSFTSAPKNIIDDHALHRQMREVESLIEESKKVIDDDDDDEDSSSDGENHVKMLNAGDRKNQQRQQQHKDEDSGQLDSQELIHDNNAVFSQRLNNQQIFSNEDDLIQHRQQVADSEQLVLPSQINNELEGDEDALEQEDEEEEDDEEDHYYSDDLDESERERR